MAQTGRTNGQTREETQSSSPDFGNLTIGSLWHGRFRINERVGAGTTSTVYRVTNTILGYTMALKVLHQPAPGSAANVRFMKEARWLSGLNHPNVLRMFSFGLSDTGAPFMIVELLRGGENLARLIESDLSIEPSRAARIALEICKAIEYLRSVGITHRDIRPSNIMVSVDEDGSESAKLIDFGLAASGITSGAVTKSRSTEIVLGSASYMSPEQCAGQPVDFAADMYAVGCMLYEMLCGQPPMKGDNHFNTMLAHIHQTVESVPAVNVIPPALEQIVLKCLQKEPSARFQSSAELETALSVIDWSTGKAMVAAAPKRRGIKPAHKIGIAALALLMASVGGAALHSMKKPSVKQASVVNDSVIKVARGLPAREKMLQERPEALERVAYYRTWLEKFAKEKSDDAGEAYFYLGEDLTAANMIGVERTGSYSKANDFYRSLVGRYERTGNFDEEKTFRAFTHQSAIEDNTGFPRLAARTLDTLLRRYSGKLAPAPLCDAYYKSAVIKAKLLDFAGAETQVRKAIEIYEHNSAASVQLGSCYCLLATCLANQQRFEEAAATIKTAERWMAKTTPSPIDPDTWIQMKADTLMAMLRLEDAMTALSEIENSKPVAANRGIYEALTLEDRWSEMVERNLSLLRNVDTFPVDSRIGPALDVVEGAQRVPGTDLDFVVDTVLSKCLPEGDDKKVVAAGALVQIANQLQWTTRKDLARKVLDHAAELLNSSLSKPAAMRYAFDAVLSMANAAIDNGDYEQALRLLDMGGKAPTPSRQFLNLCTRAVALSFMPGREKESRLALKAATAVKTPANSFEFQLYTCVVLHNLHDKSCKQQMRTLARQFHVDCDQRESDRALLAERQRTFLLLKDSFANELQSIGTASCSSNEELYHWLVLTGTQYCAARRFDMAGAFLMRACDLKCASAQTLESQLRLFNLCRRALLQSGKTKDAGVIQVRKDGLLAASTSSDESN